MNIKKFLIASSLLAGSISVGGELSLNQAQETAQANSPKLIKVKSQANEASWKRVEASSTYFPTLQLSTSYLGGYRYLLTDISFGGNPTSVPAVLPTSQAVLQVNYNLFDGFGGTNRYRSAKSLERSSVSDLNWTEFQLGREVALLYYKAISALALKEVAENNLKTLVEHQTDVDSFRKAGVSTNYDVLRVQVQVSDAESEVLSTADNVIIANSRLAEALGSSDVKPLGAKLPSLDKSLADFVKIEDLESREDIQSIREKLAATEFQEAAAERYLVPKLSLFGQYQYYNNINDRFTDTSKYRDAYSYGLMLTWNLFDGMVSISKSKQAVEQRIQAEQMMRSTLLRAKQEFEIWKRKFLYYCAVSKAKKVDVERSAEAVRLAKEGRKVGSRTNSDLLDAETDLFRSRAALVNAQMGAIESLINLELATGRKLYSWNTAE